MLTEMSQMRSLTKEIRSLFVGEENAERRRLLGTFATSCAMNVTAEKRKEDPEWFEGLFPRSIWRTEVFETCCFKRPEEKLCVCQIKTTRLSEKRNWSHFASRQVSNFFADVPAKFHTKDSYMRERSRKRIRSYLYHVSTFFFLAVMSGFMPSKANSEWKPDSCCYLCVRTGLLSTGGPLDLGRDQPLSRTAEAF